MNVFSGLLSGDKRPRSGSPPPADDLWESKMLEALKKYTPYLMSQLTDMVAIAIADAIPAALEPIRTEIADLGSKVATLEQQVVAITSSLDDNITAKIDASIAARVGVVEETVRATFEAIENKLHECTLSTDTLERQIRSPNSILFGVEESVGEKTLDEVKSLLGAGSIREALRLGKRSATAKRPRPVLIKFDSIAAKHVAFKKSKELRQRFKVSIDDDLTPKQQAARATRLPEVAELRGQGWKTFWRGDNLFKVKEGGPPVKVPLATTQASRPPSSPATGPGPSTSSRAQGQSHQPA
jgi:hypothetical protein